MDLIKKDDSLHFRYMTFPFFILYNEPYKSQLSNNAKLLYALILDRLKLSIKNKFYNEKGEVFAYISRKEVQWTLNCSDRTATKLFNELVNLKLIYEDKKHIGQTTKIFVCSITDISSPLVNFSGEGEKITGGRNNNIIHYNNYNNKPSYSNYEQRNYEKDFFDNFYRNHLNWAFFAILIIYKYRLSYMNCIDFLKIIAFHI